MPDVKEQVNQVEFAMTERGLKFEHVEGRENPTITLGFGGGDYLFSHLGVFIIFDEDGTSAHIVTSPIARVSAEKTAGVLCTLNECNQKFRWVKFFLDEDNDVIADSDMDFDEQNAAGVCIEAAVRTASIVNEAYPDIMRAVWG